MACSIYFCLLFVMTLFHPCLSKNSLRDNVLCIDIERQALIEFKDGLVDESNRLGSWVNEETDCCKWAGIVCDNSTGHVHQIHLHGTCRPYYEVQDSNQKLKGNLSSSLLHLKQLTHLDLSCNDFGGIQIPSFIGSLGNLRYLNLSRSEFVGMIPPHLGNLSKLHVLSLGSFHEMNFFPLTNIFNIQWLSNLRFLRHLDLSGVDLSKAIDWVHVINTLPSLAELHLSSCQLSLIHPQVPSLNLTSLSVLDLSYNYFNSSVPQWVFSIPSIVSLDLRLCSFYSVIPKSSYSFRNLTSLKFLDVYGNDFMNSSLVLQELSSVGSNLILLDIGSCGMSSLVLESLNNLTSLLSLDLSNNQLTEAIPISLGDLCNLRNIELSENDFGNNSLGYILGSYFECNSPRLESLSISFSELSGHIPDQIGQSMHLKHLLLPFNNILGAIPDSIGHLSSLKTLALYMNLISGPIPFSIGRLSSLETLHLSNNRINGSLPNSIAQLSSLKELYLSNNRLDGSLPSSLSQLSNLERFTFSYNLFKGIVTEAHFSKLVSLKNLNGSGNNLSLRVQVANWIPPFQLQYLYLNSWDLGPQFPLWVQSQRGLIELDISNTRISSPMPESFWRSFPNLTNLDMSQNHIKGTLSSIPATLRLLDLSSNKFSGELPDFSNGSFPLHLDLSNNFFAGSLDRLLCSDGVLKQTTTLNLGNNSLWGVIPECWKRWPTLTFVNLENNNLSGPIPRSLGSLRYLQSLNMCGNKISGILSGSLMNLTTLRILQLARNELVGSIPTWLGIKLPFLRILNLRSNNFDGNFPRELCYLKSIQILDLANNNLSGNIPRCVGNFSVLSGKENISNNPFMFNSLSNGKSVLNSDSLVMKGREDTYSTILRLVMLMDLSNNNFLGYIPSELTTLVKLKSLNLSRNGLVGTIPKMIGDMNSLESLDLSLNKLSGELPMSLSSLNYLSSFNVSYNNMTGRIPSSTQLQSLNESSFIGNGLCGAPLTERCVVEVELPDAKDQKEDESNAADWGLIISIVLGSITGFWIVLVPLMVSRSWRITYFRLLNKLRYIVYDVMHKYCFNVFSK